MNADVGGIHAATSALLEHRHPAIRDAATRAAVPHWFDDRLLTALCAVPREGTDTADAAASVPADLLSVGVRDLPFVETYSGDRLRMHELVRRSLVGELRRSEGALALSLTKAAADQLRDRADDRSGGLDMDELLELAYHLLTAEPENGRRLVDDIIGRMYVGDLAYLDRLVRYLDELEEDGQLPTELMPHSALWRICAAGMANDVEGVVRRCRTALQGPVDDPDIANEITFELVSALAAVGDRAEANATARQLVDRLIDRREQARAHVLLGTLAESPAEALGEYATALETFLSGLGVRASTRAEVLEPERWSVGIEELPPDGPSQENTPQNVFIRYSQADETVRTTADPLLCEAWLNIGRSCEDVNRLSDATRWYSVAQALSSGADYLDSYQRATAAQQRVAARAGNVEGLRLLVAEQEETRAWAAATGAAHVELQALLDLGGAYEHLDDTASALRVYGEAQTVAARLTDRHLELIAYQGLARLAVVEGRIADAISLLGTARQLPHDEASDLDLTLIEVDLWFRSRQPERAAAALQDVAARARLRSLADTEVIAILRLAMLARERFSLDRAAELLYAARGLSDRVDPLLGLDVLLELATVLRLQRHDAAAITLEELIERRATELSAGSSIGWLLMSRADTAARRGDLVPARALYERAINHFERLGDTAGLFDACCGLSWVLSENDQPAAAMAIAQRAEELAADHPSWQYRVRTELAATMVKSGDPRRAVTLMLALAEEQPDDATLYINLGWACLRAGDFDKCIEWSGKALELQPDDAFPYRNIGHAHLAAGRPVEARRAYLRAIEGRHGDENFGNTLKELEYLANRYPGLDGMVETLALFRAEQDLLVKGLGEGSPDPWQSSL